jgi:hypothetical protein
VHLHATFASRPPPHRVWRTLPRRRRPAGVPRPRVRLADPGNDLRRESRSEGRKSQEPILVGADTQPGGQQNPTFPYGSVRSGSRVRIRPSPMVVSGTGPNPHASVQIGIPSDDTGVGTISGPGFLASSTRRQIVSVDDWDLPHPPVPVRSVRGSPRASLLSSVALWWTRRGFHPSVSRRPRASPLRFGGSPPLPS